MLPDVRVPEIGAPEAGAAPFRHLLTGFPNGVAVVTATVDHGPLGLAVDWFMPVSLDPPLVAICLAAGSTRWPRIAEGGVFCVNVLAAYQEAEHRIFDGPGPSSFASLDWSVSPLGSPVLAGVLAWIDCCVDTVHEAGDHRIVVGRVQGLDGAANVLPLLAYRGRYGTFDDNRQLLGYG